MRKWLQLMFFLLFIIFIFFMKTLIKYLTELQILRYGSLRSIDSYIDMKYMGLASKFIVSFSIFP